MLSKKTEFEKAFILDTIRCTPLMRSDVLRTLSHIKHIEPSVQADLKQHCSGASVVAWDFIANFPGKTQRAILKSVKTDKVDLYKAILAVTGEVVSDDATNVAELLARWKKSSERAQRLFLDKIKAGAGK